MVGIRKHLAVPFTLALLLIFAGDASAEQPVQQAADWEFLAAPYLSVNPDFGVVFGVGGGISKDSNTTIILNSALSTKRQKGITLRGEAGTEENIYLFTFRSWLNPADVYVESFSSTDPYATGLLQRGEFKIAALRKTEGQFEFGPEVWLDFTQGIEPKTPDGVPLDINTISRFRRGSLVLGGFRARWRTTSASRPMDGVIIDFALRAGRADGIEYTTPRLTYASDFWLSYTKPFSDRLRFYSRLWVRLQDQAPTSVRNDLGGSTTLRGVPYNRDFGRRLIATRFQLPYRFASDFTLFTDIAQVFIPPFPTWKLDLEILPFADIGAVADSDLGGWKPTRVGYGVGLRLVLPPQLVFTIDLGYSPGGSTKFYFDGGESL